MTNEKESEITFLDGIDYCEVHGHDVSDLKGWYRIDIIGTLEKQEHCLKCGKIRYARKAGEKGFMQIEEPGIYYEDWK